jgi:hypothetical protein
MVVFAKYFWSHVQGCQMAYFQTKKTVWVKFGGNGVLWQFGIPILRPFGLFYGYLLYFSPFWYVAPRKIWQPGPSPIHVSTFYSIKPTLKKVSKYENKFAKLQKKAAEFNFRYIQMPRPGFESGHRRRFH